MVSRDLDQRTPVQGTAQQRPPHGGGPGDVGRRVIHRRRELGLSREAVAARAGMAPEYVQHLEEHPSTVTFDALIRLAHALETTTAALLGGGLDLPPGQGGAGPHPSVDELGAMECQRLLASSGVGRVVFISGRGPVALPVNYQLDGDDVVFRTAAGGQLAGVVGQGPVSFEVDHVDDATKQGWSVLMTGYVRLVSDGEERARLEGIGIDPWAGGDRSLYLRLVPVEMTGRRIRSGC